MLETLTLITLTVLFLVFFRPGKTEPLKSPLTINRGGQFHAVLAPMLNLAQPFLEDVSQRLDPQARQDGDAPVCCYRVRDREVRAHGQDFYLLAAALRGGMLYFQAAAPQDGVPDIDVIREFSETQLARHPSAAEDSGAVAAALISAIETAAGRRHCGLERLC